MTSDVTCKICGLPFKAATSALPLVAGVTAGAMAGCIGHCGPVRRVVRGLLAGGLTLVGTAGLRALSGRVCQCDREREA
jgi:hypothetical protein